MVFLVLAVILLLSASVLIMNTIRLAIFARRREVSVMKLVGATNWFIRVPFMFEGVAQGLFGALFASLTVFSLHFLLDSFSNTKTGNIWYQMRMPTGEVVVTSLVVVLDRRGDRVVRVVPRDPPLPRRLSRPGAAAGRRRSALVGAVARARSR